jgi:hypothetical protein
VSAILEQLARVRFAAAGQLDPADPEEGVRDEPVVAELAPESQAVAVELERALDLAASRRTIAENDERARGNDAVVRVEREFEGATTVGLPRSGADPPAPPHPRCRLADVRANSVAAMPVSSRGRSMLDRLSRGARPSPGRPGTTVPAIVTPTAPV